jgi:hypothetical protein
LAIPQHFARLWWWMLCPPISAWHILWYYSSKSYCITDK